jgi:hypothetical protein
VNKSDSITKLSAALNKFQTEVENPKNTADNPFYKSRYTPLQDVLKIVRPILSKHGLTIMQSPSGDGQSVSVTTIILHESGEYIEFDPLVLKAEKMTPQGAGIAITYGRRYSLSAVLGIASEEDDDGNALEDQSGQGNKNKQLSEKQVNRLYAIAKQAGVEPGAVKQVIMKDYNKTNIADLTKQEYDAVCGRLEQKKESA